MKEAQSRDIEGTRYTVTPLGAKQGLAVMSRLSKMIAGAAKHSETKEAAIAGALEAISADDLTFLCDVFAKLTTFANGEKEPLLSTFFDDHFSGEYGRLLQWLGFCLEVNFSSLFLSLSLKIPTMSGSSGKSSGAA